MFRRRFFTQVVSFKHLSKLFTKNHSDIYFRSISLTHYPQNTFFHSIPQHTYVPYCNYVHFYGIYEAILIFFPNIPRHFSCFTEQKERNEKCTSMSFLWYSREGYSNNGNLPIPPFHFCCHAIVRALVQIFCPLLSRSQLGCSYWSQRYRVQKLTPFRRLWKRVIHFGSSGPVL